MRKNSILGRALLFTAIVIAIPFLSMHATNKATTAAALTGVLKVCGPANYFSPDIPPFECQHSDVVVHLDETCSGPVEVSVFLTNIAPSGEEGVTYSLPNDIPDMHLRYEYFPGEWVVTEELTEVVFKGVVPSVDPGGEDILVFGIDVDLETYYSNEIGCPENDERVMKWDMGLELVTPGPGITSGFELYPVLNYSNPQTGVFSCDLFMETMCNCDVDLDCALADHTTPEYDFEVCIDCGCGNPIKEEFVVPNNHGIDFDNSNNPVAFDIMPNPFKDFVEINYAAKEKTLVEISIYDSMGKIVFQENKQFAAGKNRNRIDVTQLNPGTYFFLLDDGKVKQSKKMILATN